VTNALKKKVLTLCLLCQPPRILLGMKKRGFGAGRWNGFGGKLEQGESIEEAAKREFLEEAGITVGEIDKRGVLEFFFEGSPEMLEVHVFKAEDYEGEPVESDEMKPQWFDIPAIPYDEMWADDEFWFPIFLEGKKFTGKFYFDADENLLSHDVKAL
jgi:8-oxo-dGTP diphosphatase/2-hydroxy-dATP diphosphatase|tara:strand:+ start:1592 stop:2062 length:471 start_codon:yes stop_codon:yes gene_type:complete